MTKYDITNEYGGKIGEIRPSPYDETELTQKAVAGGIVAVAAIFIMALRWGMPVPEVRALAFFSLVVVIVSLILVNRSFSASLLTALRRPNRTLAAVLIAVALILALTLLWPFANHLFAFGPLHADDLALTLGAGFIALLVLEIIKPLLHPRRQAAVRHTQPLAMDQTPTPTER